MGPLDAHHARLVARALELMQPAVVERGGGGMATIVRGPSAEVIVDLPSPTPAAPEAKEIVDGPPRRRRWRPK